MSDSSTSSSGPPVTAEMVKALLKDPKKKALILQLLKADKKCTPDKHKTPQKNEALDKNKSSFEGPMALQRRRALEKLESDSDANSDVSSSDQSEMNYQGPKVPFSDLLRGVVAYVEVKKKGVDRTKGIQTVMECMGAQIRNEFTKDVTHVVFKDGSFLTFQKAKLKKVHLVSVLWLDAVKRNGYRVPEKKFPAFGCDFHDQNASILCSQLDQQTEKDYNGVIRDERRRTVGILQKSSKGSEMRMKTLISKESIRNDSPEVTSDDSDCGMVNGETSRKQTRDLLQSPALTDDLSTESPQKLDPSLQFLQVKGELTSLIDRKLRKKSVYIVSDMVLTPGAARKEDVIMSSLRLADSDCTNSDLGRKSEHSTSVMSDLKLSETDRTKSGLDNSLKGRRSKGSSRSDSSGTSVSEESKAESSRTDDSHLAKRKEVKASTAPQLRSRGTAFSKSSSNTSTKSQIDSDSSMGRMDLSDRANSLSSVNVCEEENVSFDTKNNNGNGKKLAAINKENRSIFVNTSLTKSQPTTRVDLRKSHFPSSKSRHSPEKKTVKRRLYNPSDPPQFIPPEDDEEREERKRLKIQSKKTDVVVNPTVLLRKLHVGRSVEKKKKEATTSESTQTDVEQIKKHTLNKRNRDESPENGTSNKKKTKQKTKNASREILNDSSSDEQKELLNKLLEEKLNPRRSIRSLSQGKKNYKDESSKETSSSSLLPITPIKRRSTQDFRSFTTSQKRKISHKLSSIVCTKMHRNEVDDFNKTTRKLGRFFCEGVVTERTSHLVAGELKRTVNMLRAIARGCWILKLEWLRKSKEKGKWLSEEDYEATEFSPAVQKCRLERQAFGPRYTINIFQDCGVIYIAKHTKPKEEELAELVTLCKGSVTKILRNANIIVGDNIKREGVKCVTEKWVLDSIEANILQPFRPYLYRPALPQSPHF